MRHNLIKSLQTAFPRGAPFDHQQLTKLGVSSALAHYHLKSGWLVRAVRAALQIAQTRHQTAAENAALTARFATLSPRDREVMEHVVAGRSLNKQIAADLDIAEPTTKVHRGRVM
jgi:DNA-binding NarL/FixJ family response regulator